MHFRQSLLIVVLSAVCLTGCGRMFAGLDGKINHRVSGNDWDEVSYGYVSVSSDPPGAVVSMQAVISYNVTMEAGIDVNQDHSGTEATEWIVVGSTPVINHELTKSGRDTSRKIGSSMRSTFSIEKLSLRFEKPGYETRVLENVAISGDKHGQPKLVVELVPLMDE